ncbi:MAG TPA: hypothetical protein VIQ03_14380, partial [Gammaproteobacteria bacterium]
LAAFGSWGGGGFDVSTDESNLTDRGDDSSSGFGAKIGWQGKVAPDIALGASYQTKMSMSEFDKYKGLFAEQGDFDIPATLIVGAAWDIDDKRKVVLDVQQIYYSDVASVGNPLLPNLGICGATSNTNPNCLGGSNGAGFGYDDMTVIKLGYQWMMDQMTMRVGISYGENPIDSSEVLFNILAPAVIETHLTFGMTMPMANNAEFSFAAMYAPENTVSGVNMYDDMGAGQQIELAMDQFEIQGTYTMKF